MEDDDEIQSQLSPESGSPVSPRSPGSPNGRIRVTVASVPPQHTPSSASLKTLTLALPIQQISSTKNGSGGGGGGRDDCWSEGATSVLIDAWGERYLELSRGNLKQKHWKEVAAIVASRDDYSKTMKTDVQCKNRIDTVKKKYKLEKSKIAAGGGPSKWQFYLRLDHLIGPSAVKISTPVGIPVGIRSASTLQKQKMQFRRRAPVDSDSDSPTSTDSLPPPVTVKKAKIEQQQQEVKSSNPVSVKISEKANSVRELTEAIVKLGEAYEQAETLKMQQVVEMEKQRMKFAKDLELQRMQFFFKTQMEISQMKKKHNHGGGGGRRNGNNHSTINNNNSNHNNNSDHSDSSN